MKEQWKSVPGFDGEYLISDQGSMLSVSHNKAMKLWTNSHGYQMAHVRISGGRWKAIKVHRLVLKTFVGESKEREICRHLDGDRTNNNLSNLQWGTHKENELDKYTHGTVLVGSKNKNAKLTEEQVLEIFLSPEPIRFFVKKYAIHETVIQKIRAKKHWVWLTKDLDKPPHNYRRGRPSSQVSHG